MADQAVGLTHPALIPRGPMVRVARTERSIISIEDGIISRDLVAKFIGLFIVIEVSFTIVFPKSSSGVAGTTILEDGERGLIDFRRMVIPFLGQLARIGRSGSMFSVHPGGKIPGVFGVEGVADDDFPGCIRAALLEVVTIRDPVIVMAGTAGLLGTVRRFTLHGKRLPVEPPEDNLLMQRHLGRNQGGIEEKENAQECH
jgi:hypothetical protein